MIADETIHAVCTWFRAHREDMERELLDRQAQERERLRCPRLREMLHKRGHQMRKERSMFNEWGFGGSKGRVA